MNTPRSLSHQLRARVKRDSKRLPKDVIARQVLGVSPATLGNWLSGRHPVENAGANTKAVVLQYVAGALVGKVDAAVTARTA